jgi:ammonium transporter, Amt family
MNPMPPIIPTSAPAMSEAAVALTLALLMLCPLAIAGVALINTGLARSRSAAQLLLGSLALISVTAIVFVFVGASLAGSLGGKEVVIHAAGEPWGVLGLGPLLLHGVGSAAPQAQLGLLFQFFAVAMLAILPWGSGADRWRMAGACIVAALLAGIVFPLAAHWIWNGGWLAMLGTNFHQGAGFLDEGGAGTVHLLGGLSALAVVWIAGPRRGKFPKEGLSTAMPGHNASYVLFGCLLALVGWLAWNSAGAILWLHAPLAALPATAINTLLSASAALAVTFSVTRFRFGKPDASLCANGWLAGLVTSSACAGIVSPAASLFIGGVAGFFTPLLVELFELALSVDDPSGAITVHGAAGLWGLLAAGIFSPAPGQFIAQLVGIATLLGVMLPLVYLLFAIANRILPFRADSEGERIGMDLHELGGGAYPEFVIHRDESYR